MHKEPNMPAMYDTTQPRISISHVDPVTYEQRERELGQAEAYGEAMFFLALGYTVHVAEWDGKCFVSRCNYLPGDL
jgi:hypothetical protein